MSGDAMKPSFNKSGGSQNLEHDLEGKDAFEDHDETAFKGEHDDANHGDYVGPLSSAAPKPAGQ